MKKICVTGCAGFIGAACSLQLLQQGYEVIGIDNLNTYYDVNLKKARLELLGKFKGFHFYQNHIHDITALKTIFSEHQPRWILHLAAQAGVRYSIDNPQSYVDSNLVGFTNMLEMARHFECEHFVYASSSSVYGSNTKMPYSVEDNVDHPVSLYAATKKANELMAHAYSHLYGFPAVGLRYFTVYGPWGRPDMAPIKFAHCILHNKPIDVYNHGDHSRDFTYIDDIVTGTLLVLLKPGTGYRIYNIGRGQPMQLLEFITLLEKALGKTAIKNFLPKQPGDVDHTWADTKALMHDFDYCPQVKLEEGIVHFAKWFKYYNSKEKL